MKNIFSQLLLSVVVLVLITGCASIRWEEARSTNTKDGYETYLRKYPKGDFADEARLKIKQLHFEQAKADDNIAAYRRFLRRYRKGALADEARLRIETLLFQKAKDTNTIEGYETYLRRYPKGKFADEARLRIEPLLFQKAKDTNTIEGYETYLRRYPKGDFADEALAFLRSLKDQIQQVQDAAISAFWNPKEAKVWVKSVSRYPSKPCFCINAVLLYTSSNYEGNIAAKLSYNSAIGRVKLVKHRCAKILKSIAKGSKLPYASELVIRGRLGGSNKKFKRIIYQISITIDEIMKHDWSSIKEEEIVELWKVDKNILDSLQYIHYKGPSHLFRK